MKWSNILSPKGVYESKVYDISSNMNSYITIIDLTTINPNNEYLKFYFSTSHDNIIWSPWEEFNKNSSDMFKNTNLSQLFFKYKIEFESISFEKRPFVQNVKISMVPYFSIENKGDLTALPKLWIRKTNESGDIKIVNHYTNQEIVFKDLVEGEEVFVDCENEDIISSRQSLGVYRYDSHNDEWLELETGVNLLRGEGDFDLDYRFQSGLLNEGWRRENEIRRNR